MNTTKRLIEQLEKLTNKKVLLKEDHEKSREVYFSWNWGTGTTFTKDEINKIDNVVSELFMMGYDTKAYDKDGSPIGLSTWEPGEFPENFSCLREHWDSLEQTEQALLQKYFKIY